MKIPNYYKILFNKMQNKEISKEEYKEELFKCSKNEDVPIRHFFKAHYYYFEKEELEKARAEIEQSIELLQKYSEKTENTIDIHDIFEFIEPYKIYDFAGQIYARLEDIETSRKYYNLAICHMIDLKPEFNDSCTLYSFRKVDKYTLSDLYSKTITVLSPKKMNDPFDSLYMQWASEEKMKDFCKEQNHIQPFCQSFEYFKIRSFNGNKKATSDDEIVRKVKMWSHYADEHKGFCVKYKLYKNLIKKEGDKDGVHWFLKRVEYSSSSQKIDLTNRETMNTTELLATKSHEWKDEGEFRLIYYNASCQDEYAKIPLKEGAEIEAIYFGCNCPKSDIEIVVQAAGEGIQFYKMEKDLTNIYKLGISKLK